jgi:hypothetical protein
MWTPPSTTTSSTVALILLALIAGGIWATALAMVHVWIHHRGPRGGRHRHGGTAVAGRPAPTLVIGDHPDALAPADPDLTVRLPAAADLGPTAVLSAVVDPWRDREDADSLLALAV